MKMYWYCRASGADFSKPVLPRAERGWQRTDEDVDAELFFVLRAQGYEGELLDRKCGDPAIGEVSDCGGRTTSAAL